MAKTTTTTTTTTTVNINTGSENKAAIDSNVTPKGLGKLDMVIAFDTTGSMAAYIDDVREQVKELIPRLFKDNEDLRLGIVAFGDYCDMKNAQEFGKAYQCISLTDSENDLIKFVNDAKNTNGGDGDEFYELVLKKIIDEMQWREDSQKAILLIADANPHPVGYSYRNIVECSQIDWRKEAQRAAEMMIKIDTVSIHGLPWYQQLSAMTNGICVPFRSSGKTSAMIETATTARSAMAYHSAIRDEKDENRRRAARMKYDTLRGKLRGFSKMMPGDAEMSNVYKSYDDELDLLDDE